MIYIYIYDIHVYIYSYLLYYRDMSHMYECMYIYICILYEVYCGGVALRKIIFYGYALRMW